MLFTNRRLRSYYCKGHTMIGWNDIMGKNIHEWADSDNESTHTLAPYAVVQFWNGDTALIAEALKNKVIESSTPRTGILTSIIIIPKIPLKKPTISLLFPAHRPGKYKPLLLGSGCQMSEWIPRIEDMQRCFPHSSLCRIWLDHRK